MQEHRCSVGSDFGEDDAMADRYELRPLGHPLGTEALGIDLSRALDDDRTISWIEAAFAEHPVLVFREQNLGPGDIAAFGRRFGKPKIHSLVDYRHAEYPEVSWLTNVDRDGNIDWFGVKRATDWHTDSPYEETPPRLAILHAKEVPNEKGGTMFADMRAAYDGLPQAMKDRLAGMTGLHGRDDGPAGVRLYGADPKHNLDREYPEKARPAVVRHPVSGRAVLFVNPLHMHGFVGMAKEDAWRLIEELTAHATQDRFVYYHSWRVGDVLMWDECATMHRGAGDYRPDERRIMLRTIVYPN
jgi:taurine dioxygenase